MVITPRHLFPTNLNFFSRILRFNFSLIGKHEMSCRVSPIFVPPRGCNPGRVCVWKPIMLWLREGRDFPQWWQPVAHCATKKKNPTDTTFSALLDLFFCFWSKVDWCSKLTPPPTADSASQWWWQYHQGALVVMTTSNDDDDSGGSCEWLRPVHPSGRHSPRALNPTPNRRILTTTGFPPTFTPPITLPLYRHAR